jgi:hypothetical protein
MDTNKLDPNVALALLNPTTLNEAIEFFPKTAAAN